MDQKKAARSRLVKPLIGIIMGSSSDLPVMKQALDVLKELHVPAEITVVSAHRTPQRMARYAHEANRRGLKIIIAGAGGAAHLPGMIAAFSSLPVIGVPIHSSNSILGLDSLLSIVQMPAGIPVATVAINGAKNAGLLAAMFLAMADQDLAKRMQQYKQSLANASRLAVDEMRSQGLPNFFDGKKIH